MLVTPRNTESLHYFGPTTQEENDTFTHFPPLFDTIETPGVSVNLSKGLPTEHLPLKHKDLRNSNKVTREQQRRKDQENKKVIQKVNVVSRTLDFLVIIRIILWPIQTNIGLGSGFYHAKWFSW